MAVLNERGHHQTDLEPLKYLFFISSLRDANAHGMERAGLEPLGYQPPLKGKKQRPLRWKYFPLFFFFFFDSAFSSFPA